MKIIDWRTGKNLQPGDIADWGPAPKWSWFYPDVKGEMVNGVGVITPNEDTKQKIPYNPEWHNPGYQLLEIREDSLTKGSAKLRSLKTNKIFWYPLSIRFLTKDGLRVGYIID